MKNKSINLMLIIAAINSSAVFAEQVQQITHQSTSGFRIEDKVVNYTSTGNLKRNPLNIQIFDETGDAVSHAEKLGVYNNKKEDIKYDVIRADLSAESTNQDTYIVYGSYKKGSFFIAKEKNIIGNLLQDDNELDAGALQDALDNKEIIPALDNNSAALVFINKKAKTWTFTDKNNDVIAKLARNKNWEFSIEDDKTHVVPADVMLTAVAFIHRAERQWLGNSVIASKIGGAVVVATAAVLALVKRKEVAKASKTLYSKVFPRKLTLEEQAAVLKGQIDAVDKEYNAAIIEKNITKMSKIKKKAIKFAAQYANVTGQNQYNNDVDAIKKQQEAQKKQDAAKKAAADAAGAAADAAQQ